MATGLTDDQKAMILERATQSQNFLHSNLFKQLTDWMIQEKVVCSNDIVYDRRGIGEDKLTREQFVERRSAYYIALDTVPSIIKNWSGMAEQIKKLEEAEQNGQPE